jgi:hypothetical protein
MAGQPDNHRDMGIGAILIGVVAVAVCCFTPFIIAALGAASLGALFRHYLGYFLLIAAVILVIIAALSYRSWRSAVPPVGRIE